MSLKRHCLSLQPLLWSHCQRRMWDQRCGSLSLRLIMLAVFPLLSLVLNSVVPCCCSDQCNILRPNLPYRLSQLLISYRMLMLYDYHSLRSALFFLFNPLSRVFPVWTTLKAKASFDVPFLLSYPVYEVQTHTILSVILNSNHRLLAIYR